MSTDSMIFFGESLVFGILLILLILRTLKD